MMTNQLSSNTYSRAFEVRKIFSFVSTSKQAITVQRIFAKRNRKQSLSRMHSNEFSAHLFKQVEESMATLSAPP